VHKNLGYRRLLLATLGFASATFYVTTAAAQSAPAPVDTNSAAQSPAPGSTDAKAAPPTSLTEVIVQARRSDERLQSVPLAVTALSRAQLSRDTITSAYDIQRLAPSIVIEPDAASGQEDFLIRGSFAGVGNDPSVVTYVDEVPQDSRTIAYGLFDINSVQELKGPQGTLFGRNSTGGAVLFFSQKPSLAGAGGYLDAQYGNYNERRIEGGLNMPLGNDLALRIAGEGEQRDGTLVSVTDPGLQYNNRNNGSVRASLLWQPNSQIQNVTQVTGYQVRQHFSDGQPISFDPNAADAFLDDPRLATYVAEQKTLPSDRTVSNSPATNNVDKWSVQNTFTYTGDIATIHNILYYGASTIDFSKNFTATPVPDFLTATQDRYRNFYTDTYASGQVFKSLVNWRVGFVFSDDLDDQAQFESLYPYTGFLAGAQPQNVLSHLDFKSTAVYTQEDIDLSALLKGLKFTAGYRYTWDDRTDASQALAGVAQTCAFVAGTPGLVPGSCLRNQSLNSSDSNYNFSLNWQASKDLLLYVAERKGYKSGSFNAFESDPALSTFAPEVVYDTEVGLKSDLRIAGIPIRNNIALFSDHYDNIQTTAYVQTSQGTIEVTLNSNPASGTKSTATIQGFEWELTAKPLPWLEVSGFYSRTDAKYNQFVTYPAQVNLANTDIGGVVPSTFGVSATAHIPVSGPFDGAELFASYYKAGEQESGPLYPIVQTAQESVDARLMLHNFFKTGADIAFYGKNLTNQLTCPTNPSVFGENVQVCGDPRTYGIQLTYRFGSDRR